ncbi:lytic transglycosylase domain-containing protein [Salsuginibacillus kocurii]|uniref:lytic transglycosylase domain-containing protein n=1 Tax=Salsuginibacillus kocurii TaxID=427078 RepID=UPI000374D301|nr:lytic transglycosylase domain-containing protein [Salsuginibacillus kocurii]
MNESLWSSSLFSPIGQKLPLAGTNSNQSTSLNDQASSLFAAYLQHAFAGPSSTWMAEDTSTAKMKDSLYLHPELHDPAFQTAAFSQEMEAVPAAGTSEADDLPNSAAYKELIEEAGAKYDVDPSLIYAVMKQESNFNPDAKSHAGAMGLMQLMPGTSTWLGVNDPYDPKENIEGGTKYLRDMLDRYNGNTELALAAYNAGPGNVDKHGGIPPFQETEHYVPTVMGTYRSFA